MGKKITKLFSIEEDEEIGKKTIMRKKFTSIANEEGKFDDDVSVSSDKV